MTTLYDEDGNAVEGAASPEELKALQEKQTELEAKAKEAEDLGLRLKEKEEALQKFSNKDFNFQKLRDKSEEEIAALKTKMSEKEKLLLDEVMELRREKDEEKSRRFAETKEEVLKQLSGGDDAKRKSIELAEKELVGEAKTPKELEDRYRKAFVLSQGQAPGRNPLYSGYSSTYREPDLTPKNFTETEQGKDSLRKWFPEIANKIIKK